MADLLIGVLAAASVASGILMRRKKRDACSSCFCGSCSCGARRIKKFNGRKPSPRL